MGQASERGVKVRIWRDVNEAARLSDFDVEAQLGGFRASSFGQARRAAN